MASVGFFIDKSKNDKKKRAPIVLQFDFDQKRFKMPTREKIESRYWSTSKQRAKDSYSTCVSLNTYLDGLQDVFMDIYRDLKSDGKIPTPELIKNEFTKQQKKVASYEFFSLFDNYVKVSETTKAKGTIKNYKNCRFYYKEFANHSGFSFDFNEINLAFCRDFINYLIEKKKLSNNTIGRVIKVLKTFLNWAADNGLNKNYDYKKFKIFKEEIEIIYLTKEELYKLYNKELTSQPQVRSRDLFCFGCFTGLRFSDISKIIPSDIKEDSLIVRTKKTKDQLLIPLLPEAKAILEKYNYKLPIISSQKLNLNLKTICGSAEITEEISINRYRGAEVINSKSAKCDLVTTHTARRTFITLSLELGLRPEVVMSITGHKDYKTMRPYIKIVDRVKKDELFNAWK